MSKNVIENKSAEPTPEEQAYLKKKGEILAELTAVFQKHNCDPNMSVEIMAEMLMQIFVGMQWMTAAKMETTVLPFFQTLKKKAEELLPQIRKDRDKAIRQQKKES